MTETNRSARASDYGSEELAEGIVGLAAVLADAERLVAFTGAGISTESGIPDFRSPGGIWNRYKPIDYQTFLTSDEGKREYWRRGRNTYTPSSARPARIRPTWRSSNWSVWANSIS